MRQSREGTFDRRYERAARWFLAHGVRPNHFTFLQLPVFAAMVWAALGQHAWPFALLSLLVIVLDGGDGILARVGGMQSRLGAFLDATMDTLGIAVVMWGAAQFFPFVATWLLLGLFLLNVGIYLQNNVLDEKVVSYVRGPVIIPVVFPDTLAFGLFIAYALTVWVLVWRLPATMRTLRAAAG